MPELKLSHPDWWSCCHHAPVRAGGVEDFPGSGYICTVYHVCTECGEPCASYSNTDALNEAQREDR
jgi:hypothetical protein